MFIDVITRGLVALIIIGVGVGFFWLISRILITRARGKRLGLEAIKPGIPAILYFTTPDCLPCKTVQRPELQKLAARLEPDLQIIEVDASSQPELADYWGVLSVPTTFIIDSKGRPRQVNYGVTRADKLFKQIQSAERDGRYKENLVLR
jgi:thioredoxin 1